MMVIYYIKKYKVATTARLYMKHKHIHIYICKQTKIYTSSRCVELVISEL